VGRVTITEANAVNTVLRYLFHGASLGHGRTKDGAERAQAAAELLADKAHKVLAAGYTADDVREEFPDNGIRVLAHAYVRDVAAQHRSTTVEG